MLFATATDWVTRLSEAHDRGRLAAELTRLRRYGLIIVDEVGYLPFEQDAANLFFQLVSSRYEHASLILTSNLPFSSWAGVFGDQVVQAENDDRIEVGVLFGSVDVVVPEGVRAETSGFTVFGSTECLDACSEPPGPDTSSVVVDTRGAFGSVDIVTPEERDRGLFGD